jgi:hypothetical protein
MGASALAFSRLLSGRRHWIEALATGALVSVTAIYAGRALADVQVRTFGLGHGSTFAFTLIALVVMALLRAASFAAFLGVAILTVFNGIPGINLDTFTTAGSFRVSDVAVAALMVVLATRQRVDASAAKPVRLARVWGFGFVLWWMFTLVRSVLDGVPVRDAALFGRDFLYFAILVPLFVGALARRRDIYTVLYVIGAGTLIYALAQIGVTALGLDRVGPIRANLFIHETFSNELGGLHRVYSFMGDTVGAALPFSLGLALVPPRRSLRIVGVIATVIGTLSVLFAFTRATYLGLAFAFLLISAVWIRQGSSGGVALRRVSVAALAVVLALIISGGYRPLLYSSHATATASNRASTALADLQNRRGTVQYRYDLQKQMRKILGNHWLEGLGFWHPKAHPVASLPSQSIRNSDVGVLNSIMTMGVVGTLFLYAPLLGILIAIFRLRRRGSSAMAAHEWFFYGLSLWLTYLLISSISLVTLFTVSGLVLTALMLGCAARLLTEPESQEWSPS